MNSVINFSQRLENFIHDIKKASDEFNLNLHNKTSYFEPNQITDLMSHVRPEAFTKLRLDLMDDENFEIFQESCKRPSLS